MTFGGLPAAMRASILRCSAKTVSAGSNCFVARTAAGSAFCPTCRL
jgi:hypothetical protein